MTFLGSILRTALFTAFTVAGLSGCQGHSSTSATVTHADADLSACQTPVSPAHTFARVFDREPSVSIPMLPGWRTTTFPTQGFVRGLIDNPSMANGKTRASMLVAMDWLPLPNEKRRALVEWGALADEFNDVARSGEVDSVRMVGKCGHSGMEVRYRVQGQLAYTFILAVRDDDRTWRARVNFLAPDEHGAEWEHQVRDIVSGMIVSAPGR